MASRIVMQGIVEIAKPIGATIRQGKPIATAVGGLVGAGLGASTWFFMAPQFVPICIAVGILAGATSGGAVFKRPARSAGARATDLEPFRLGKVLQVGQFVQGDFRSITVLLDNALYVVRIDKDPWEPIVQKLTDGLDPELPHGDLIRFDELLRMEVHSPDALDITLVHRPAGRTRQRIVDVQTIAVREELIAYLEQQIGKKFMRRKCPLETSRAIMVPGILAAVGTVLFSLIAWVSAHWKVHPPAFPQGKNKPDELVNFLVSLGPGKILLVGSVAVLAALAWLASRIIWPPMIEVLQVQDEDTPLRNDPV